MGLEEPSNKRIFTKNKSKNEMTKNEKTSTNDLDEMVTKKSNLKRQSNLSNLSTIDVPSNLQIIKKSKSESLQTFSRRKKHKLPTPSIKYDLNELKNNINETNTKINDEKNISLNTYNSLNNEIITKNVKIKNLAEEQKDLISKLKIIKNVINNKIEKANILVLKKTEENKKEKILQKLINVKEKEIILENKKNENIKKEYKRIITIINSNDINKENDLKKELFVLKNEIFKLEQNIKKLKTILEHHKYCDKHKSELLNYLSLLKNSYQFEIKKNTMTINSESESELNHNSNNKSIYTFHSPKIKNAKNIFNNKDKKKILLKNIKSQSNLNSKRISNYINNILNNMSEECYKDVIKTNKSSNVNNKIKKKNLFNYKENFVLGKIIPNRYLVKCKERFDNIENENNKLKEKINLEKIKKERLISEKQIKIGINEIKIKESKKEEFKLNIDIYKNKKIIDELKKKINEINKETKKYKNLINIKNKQNLNLRQRMQEFKKHTKKGKKRGKKEEVINNNEEEYELFIKKDSVELKQENQKNNINYHPKKK